MLVDLVSMMDAMASTTRVAQRGPVASMRCSSREMVTTSGASRASENAMTGCSVTSGNFAPRTRPSKAPGASASTTSLMASFAATIARSTGFDASRNHVPNVAGAGLDDEAVTDHVTVRAALARATAHARTARRAPARSDRARARRAASRRFGDATREVSPSSKSGLTCFVRETNPFQRSWFIASSHLSRSIDCLAGRRATPSRCSERSAQRLCAALR